MFIYYGSVGAGVFAFCLGFITDLFSADLNGLYAFSYLIAFGGISLGSRFLDIQYPRGQILLVLVGVLLKEIIGFLIVAAYLGEFSFALSNFLGAGLFAGLTALMAPIVFRFLNSLRAAGG